MRWLGSLVAENFRILMRGGLYAYPGDARKGYSHGRLRLLYEANPVALIIEQAGGACVAGAERMLDVHPHSSHQRVPLIFGSKSEVEEMRHYYREPHSFGDRFPLFAQRGLFRSLVG
jgi:fructose-1,6-bisphosphatase I